MSKPNAIPEGARALVGATLHSVEELETLLLLHRHPSRRWAADQLAQELKFGPDRLRLALEGLIAHRFAAKTSAEPPVYEYLPQLAPRSAAVAELAAAYEDARGEVLILISGQAIDRVRTGALRMFSDSLGGPGKGRRG